jgi:hypothetical protein
VPPALDASTLAHPASTFRTVWNFLALFGIAFYVVEVPLMIASMYDPDWVRRFQYDLIVSYFFDVFFIVDFYMRATFFAVDRIGAIVSDPAEIRNQFMSRKWALKADVIALLPLDLIALGVSTFYLPVLRICKLLRMAYLPVYAKRVEASIRDKTGIQLSFTPHRIVVLYCVLFIVSRCERRPTALR